MKAKDFIILPNRAIYPIGDYVAVCAAWKIETRTTIIDGIQCRAYVKVPVLNGAYIDFCYLREAPDGEVYEDEDNIGSMGMDYKTALQVADELQQATKYLETGVSK